METLIITATSYEERKRKHDEYSRLIRDSLQEKEKAREQGDLSENFGYVEAKNEVEKYRRMQGELGLHSTPLHIVDPKEWANASPSQNPSVQIGKMVEISINNFRETLLIGGAWDADLNKEEIVPYTSPLAKCLLKKHAGEKSTLPTNKALVEILKVETPSPSFIQKLYSTKTKRPPDGPDLLP